MCVLFRNQSLARNIVLKLYSHGKFLNSTKNMLAEHFLYHILHTYSPERISSFHGRSLVTFWYDLQHDEKQDSSFRLVLTIILLHSVLRSRKEKLMASRVFSIWKFKKSKCGLCTVECYVMLFQVQN